MLSHLGLRSRMAASYMLVTAAAVLLVEASLLVVVVPRVRVADEAANRAQAQAIQAEVSQGHLSVRSLARGLAASVGAAATVTVSAAPGSTDRALINGAARGAVDLADGTGADTVPFGVVQQVVADVSGRVVAASRQPAGSTLREAARSITPAQGRTTVRGSMAYWATAPIHTVAVGEVQRRTIGIAYVELSISKPAPDGRTTPSDAPPAAAPADQPTVEGKDPRLAETSTATTAVSSLVLPGIVALVLLIPVGALFGLLSTGRLIRRIRRLAEGTSAMAGGDLGARVPVRASDEVGRLERAFNSMAERLQAAVAEQRATAAADARRAERNRIARELHDSISQELFSVSMVAAGMRKALSPGSVLQEQAQTMQQSLERTMREMRALLLELRPIQLEDAGLAAALQELCATYEARLGIPITTDIESVPLDATAENAVLRVVQEAVGNAIRHGAPTSIEVRLGTADGRIEATVRDDGRGFDPHGPDVRHGMGTGMMRERMREVGGVVEIDSAAGQGTTVRVSLPARAGDRVG